MAMGNMLQVTNKLYCISKSQL